MRPKDYLKNEITEVEHCTSRLMCPIGDLCGVSRCSDGSPLFPTIATVEKDELIWTNLRYENRVHIIQSGVFTCMAHCESENEIPFALFGKGNIVGAVELYAPRSMSSDYHVRTLIPGKVCSVSAKALKRKMEELSPEHAQRIMCCAFASQSASAFTQSKVISSRSLYERVLTLFLHLGDLIHRSEEEGSTFAITHEEIALLVASDRVSVTRVLHKMRDEGIIKLGYKSISFFEDAINVQEMKFPAHTNFFIAETRISDLLSRKSIQEEDLEDLYVSC